MTTPNGLVVGYVRTGTDRQHFDLQLDALRKVGADPVFRDRVSGARAARPALDKALAELQPGDNLSVWKLDRLGRSLQHLISNANAPKERGVAFLSPTESIDTATHHGPLLFM